MTVRSLIELSSVLTSAGGHQPPELCPATWWKLSMQNHQKKKTSDNLISVPTTLPLIDLPGGH